MLTSSGITEHPNNVLESYTSATAESQSPMAKVDIKNEKRPPLYNLSLTSEKTSSALDMLTELTKRTGEQNCPFEGVKGAPNNIHVGLSGS